jgi:uncharacterized membrane protein
MENNYTENYKENKKFDSKLSLMFGWDCVKKNFWFLIVVFAFDLLILYLPSIVGKITDKVNFTLPSLIFYFVFNLVFWIMGLIVSLGFLHITVLLASGVNASFSDLFSKAGKIFNCFISSILCGIIVALGFILFIVPGIIFAIRFQFFQYLIIEGNLGPIQALEASWNITKGETMNLIIFWILVLLVNVLGALALGIGLFVTLPLTMIATAYVYKKLAN